MRVLIAAAELSPLARSGGLGEAVAGLARALATSGVEVTVVVPRYRGLAGAAAGPPAPPADGTSVLEQHGYRVVLVDDPSSFDRPGMYGPEPGRVYDDEWRRWARFGMAVRHLASNADVVHVHDSHPAFAVEERPTVLTVHNGALSVMGPLPDVQQMAGATAAAFEHHGRAHFLRAAALSADAVTTVSPGYAAQLVSDPTVSSGLDAVFAALDPPVVGIVNGIDAAAWDPANDESLPARYRAGELDGKSTCRTALAERTGLRPGVTFGVVGRMTHQKGLDLLDPVLDGLVDDGFRLVAVGNGELDPLLHRWVALHPTAVAHLPYHEKLARLVFAGSDAYLMPSRFEPCGLAQMYAMRYGTPPVVHLTGGLADTVTDAASGQGTGFGFAAPEPELLAAAVHRAMTMLEFDPEQWRRVQQSGMTRDWSWRKPATAYRELYDRLTET